MTTVIVVSSISIQVLNVENFEDMGVRRLCFTRQLSSCLRHHNSCVIQDFHNVSITLHMMSVTCANCYRNQFYRHVFSVTLYLYSFKHLQFVSVCHSVGNVVFINLCTYHKYCAQDKNQWHYLYRQLFSILSCA